MSKSDESFSDEDVSSVYYFESDHVALKENSDYRNVLHTIAVLEAQRQQAARDIETLYDAQDKALSNPLVFVEDLQQGKDMGFPRPQKIVPLPEIQWNKYTSSVNFTSFGNSRHMTRNKKNAPEAQVDPVQSLKSKLIQGIENTTLLNSTDPDVIVVRGRAKDSSKPISFNQLWTDEEQQRLESLLIQYPPEEVESRRWGKIANALGNRTPVQVASRVQKYFLRLAKEGLPVPGRMPSLTAHCKRSTHKQHRYNRMYLSSSTFLQSHVPPVWMPDEGEDTGASYAYPSSSYNDTDPSSLLYQMDDSSDDEMIPPELQNTPEYLELQRLKQMKKDKLSTEKAAVVRHIGYKCDNCGSEPIIGTRWHCKDCMPDDSYDLCDECSDVSFQHGKHNSSHRLQPFIHAVLDSDYLPSKVDYNYLDSNYMPAS